LLNPEDALLTARYLVENNEEPIINLNEYETADNLVIESIFKNLVRCYKVMSPEEEKQKMIELANVSV